MLAVTLIIVLSSLFALLAAIASQALSDLSWHELQDYSRLIRQERVFDDIHDRADSVVVATENLQVIATLTTAGGMYHVLGNPPWSWQTSCLTAVFAFAMLVLTVWIPRNVAWRWGVPFLLHTWGFWRTLEWISSPLLWINTAIHRLLGRLDHEAEEHSDEDALEDEILAIVAEGQHDGLLEPDVREMIEGVIELDETDVADIMTPRSEMDAVSIETDWPTLLRFVAEVGRTRLPVYGTNLDDIRGVLYVKDLLGLIAEERSLETSRLEDVLREPWKVPRTTRLDELLQMFLKNHNHLALVVDEFMHVVGLVTIEDVLEEIVGEIEDESDEAELTQITWLSDQVAEVDARAHVEEINEALGIRLPEQADYDTVGGFLLSQLGRIPEQGEWIDWQNRRIVVVESSGRRIKRVRIEPNPRPQTLGSTGN